MTLPDDFLVRRLRDQWAVVGPTGVFLVGRSDGDTASAALRTAASAHLLRTRLADVVPWTPFVNAVVVADAGDGGWTVTVRQGTFTGLPSMSFPAAPAMPPLQIVWSVTP